MINAQNHWKTFLEIHKPPTIFSGYSPVNNAIEIVVITITNNVHALNMQTQH